MTSVAGAVAELLHDTRRGFLDNLCSSSVHRTEEGSNLLVVAGIP